VWRPVPAKLQKASSIALGIRPERILSLAFDPRATGYSDDKAVVLSGRFWTAYAVCRMSRPRAWSTSSLEHPAAPAGLPGRTNNTRRSPPPSTRRAHRPSPAHRAPRSVWRLAGLFQDPGHRPGERRDLTKAAAGHACVNRQPPAIVNDVVVTAVRQEDPVGLVVTLEGTPHRVIAVRGTQIEDAGRGAPARSTCR